MEMLEYADFYDIAEYGNSNWKGSYTARETACNAYDYYAEYKRSIYIKEETNIIKRLTKLLDNDGSEEAKFWSTQIRNSIVTAARV